MQSNGRLPPLSALRAFETTADELSVTPAAISHQIYALEADLGVGLFKRLNRSVELTRLGTRAAAWIVGGLPRHPILGRPTSSAEASRGFSDIDSGTCGMAAAGVFDIYLATSGWDFCTGVGSPLGYFAK